MTTSPALPRLLAPVHLPPRLDGTRLDHLSASSLALFWRCSESWRARYLARIRGPESAELRRGWVVDAAIDIDWGDDTPEHVKDTGLIALRAYLAELAPTVRPTSVQREFAFALAPELEWLSRVAGRLSSMSSWVVGSVPSGALSTVRSGCRLRHSGAAEFSASLRAASGLGR